VAKWLAHLPFTSKVAGSSLSENFSMRLEPSPNVKKSKKSTLCRKSWVFSGYSGFLPQGKLTGWVRHIGQGGGQIINEVWTNSGCSSAICKLKVYLGLLHVSPVLSIYSQCNQSLKSPERECAVKYLYLYLYLLQGCCLLGSIINGHYHPGFVMFV
jgi:hypothetical protein